MILTRSGVNYSRKINMLGLRRFLSPPHFFTFHTTHIYMYVRGMSMCVRMFIYTCVYICGMWMYICEQNKMPYKQNTRQKAYFIWNKCFIGHECMTPIWHSDNKAMRPLGRPSYHWISSNSGGGKKATSHEEVIYFLSINLCCEHMLTDITNTRRYLWRITFRTCTSGHTTHLLNEDGARICLLIVLCQEFYIDFSVTLQDSSFYNLREKGSMTLIKLSKDIHLVCYTAEIPPVQYLFNVLPLSIASR